MPLIIDSEHFEKVDFSQEAIATKEFESCTFSACTFSEMDLAEITFYDCDFDQCDLGTIKVKNTAFKDVRFNSCKIMGVDFAVVNPFLLEMNFNDCQLDFSSFHALDLRKSSFTSCRLMESDLSKADLRKVVLKECDLSRCLFELTDLRDADFRTAQSYSIDPENNMLAGARFSLVGLPGLIEKYGIRVD